MQREKFGVLDILVQKLYATKKMIRAMISNKKHKLIWNKKMC